MKLVCLTNFQPNTYEKQVPTIDGQSGYTEERFQTYAVHEGESRALRCLSCLVKAMTELGAFHGPVAARAAHQPRTRTCGQQLAPPESESHPHACQMRERACAPTAAFCRRAGPPQCGPRASRSRCARCLAALGRSALAPWGASEAQLSQAPTKDVRNGHNAATNLQLQGSLSSSRGVCHRSAPSCLAFCGQWATHPSK